MLALSLVEGILALVLVAVAQEPDPRTLALLDAVERLHREIGDPSDVRAAAARLGHDRARILESVKALGWEPYAGVLRGAAGTLAAGSGNSIDRALLLQALLEAGGVKTRLMRGALDPADGAALLAAFRPRRAAAAPIRAADLGLDPAVAAKAAKERKRETAALLAEVLEAARPEAARLGGLLGAREPKALDAPSEHWWVQVEEKGAWTDLDPSPVPLKAKSGAPVAAKDLGPLRRSVRFRVVLDRKAGGKADPQTLLDTSFEGTPLQARGVDFVLGPDARGATAPDKLEAMDPKAKLAALKAVKIWRAGLVVDGRQYGARPFDLQGNVYDVDAGGVAGAAAGIGRAAGGLFGGAFGGEEAPAFVFERLSLELEIREPGAEPRLHRRVLLAAGEPWLPIAKLAFRFDGAPPARGERSRRAISALARNAPAFRKALTGDVSGVRLDSRAEPPARLSRFASLHRMLCDRIAEGGAWTQDRLGVLAETSRLFEADGAGRILRGVDLYENPVRFAGPEGAARTRTAGVADTLLESLLLARSIAGEAGPTAWSRLERARLEGAKEELAEEGGRVLLRPAAGAWWELDPASGAFVGRVAGGGGQGALEAAWENGSNVCQASDAVALWGTVPDGPELVSDAADAYGNFCSLFSGTTVRDKLMDKIKNVNKDLWGGTLDALEGSVEEEDDE